MITESPLSGIGLNTFPSVYDQRPEYEGHYICAGIAHAHNTLVPRAVDFGLPGMVAVAGIMAALAWTALRTAHRLGATPMAPLIVGLSFELLAHALHGLVDSVAIGLEDRLHEASKASPSQPAGDHRSRTQLQPARIRREPGHGVQEDHARCWLLAWARGPSSESVTVFSSKSRTTSMLLTVAGSSSA